jgi:hypothetical protein
MDMPLAPSNRKHQTQAAVLKPWVNPYQGTTVRAAANVRENIAVVTQLIGGSLASVDAVIFRGSQRLEWNPTLWTKIHHCGQLMCR